MLSPILQVDRPILDRFQYVWRLDLLSGLEIGDGLRNLDDPRVCAHGKMESINGFQQQL